jgi:hypothetical protein
MSRPLCICGYRFAAINYVKNGKTYYRKKCDICIKHGVYTGIPLWYRDGYRIKNKCDYCGYASKHREQFDVYFVDQNMKNTRLVNLRCVCANCQRILAKEGKNWSKGARPDF